MKWMLSRQGADPFFSTALYWHGSLLLLFAAFYDIWPGYLHLN